MKIKISVLIIFVLTVAVVGFTIQRNLPEKTPVSPEASTATPETNADSPMVTAIPEKQGAFEKVTDRYSVTGSVEIQTTDTRQILRISDDFTISSGPDLYIHFGKDGTYVETARVARLSKLSGKQEYEIPDSIDPTMYNEVWIWCRAFAVPFAVAKLEVL